MNINYFLSSKNKLQKILSHLNEIKFIYCEIKLESIDCINTEYIDEQINDCEKKINELEITFDIFNKLIYCNCDHVFVDDLIDITPDKSQHITYCTICEYTKE